MKNYLFFFGVFVIIFSHACSNSDEPEIEIVEPMLSATPKTLSFSADGGQQIINVTSNITWSVLSSESWCKSSVTSSKANASITITANASYIEAERSATLTISSGETEPVIIEVEQDKFVPDPKYVGYIDPDNTGMSDNAITLASKMYLGWNLGNTMEAMGGETAWGNPKTTNELILAVKAAGFNSVRIPCSWDQNLIDQTDYRIKESWLKRVEEVVDYCVNNDMYAILNIHWDGGWMENNISLEKQEEIGEKLETIWKQIAIYFRDYDEKLLFAGANEPNADNQQQADVLTTHMQTFIDVVRATGGRNSYRNLVVQAPYTDIDKADEFMTMPNDEIENRLLAEAHYYSPYQFCIMEEDADWGNVFYFWGAPYHFAGAEERYPNWNCEEDYMEAQFNKMKSKFVDQGIPVILGEFGVAYRTISESSEWQQKHDESRAYFYKNVAERGKNNGLIPFLWDTGQFIGRDTNTVIDSLSHKGLITGAEAGKYPF